MAGQRLIGAGATRHANMRVVAILLGLPALLWGQSHVFRDDSPRYTDFLNPDFPFLEATIDLRGIAPAGNTDNLIPRALLLPLDEKIFVCFDTELLRVAAVWQGDFITPEGIAILSYPVPLRKMDGGQEHLPKPIGSVIAATGLYPGWHRHGNARFEDPRPRWLDTSELGRGPLPPGHGEWIGAEDSGSSVVLHYTLFGGEVREHFRVERADGDWTVVRSIELHGVDGAVDLVTNDTGPGAAERYTTESIPARGDSQSLCVSYPRVGDSGISEEFEPFDFGTARKGSRHWPETITTEIEHGKLQGSYAVDHLRLPYPNPWKRRIRPTGIDFFPNGDAVIVTIDGDVYQLCGLGADDGAITWTRIAAGFHEPQSIRIRGDDVFVFSRLGVTQLIDRDGDGEADFYQMFCNRFTQSGDTRDFPLSLVSRNDGSFIISKGGQQVTANSPHSGRVLHISGDGKDVDFWAYGLRNGYLNAIPEKDLITASDQQGNWVPSTPFHIVRKDSFLGYEPGGPRTEVFQAQPAALWLPHHISQSAIDPIWAGDARLGALHGSVLMADYTKPGVTKILLPENGEIVQASAVPLDLDFEVPLLKGAVNPTDGMIYLVGFQIWSSFAKRIEGLCRLRVVSEADADPTRAKIFKEGVLLSFFQPLDAQLATDPASYIASSWDYKRTAEYGSARYRKDGVPGVDSRFIHSVLTSGDGRSVFVAIEDMPPAMQVELQHRVSGEWSPVYFTANVLPTAPLEALGFEVVDFDALFASAPAARDETVQETIVSEARGQEVALIYGCIACHSIDGTTDGKVGPSWRGLYGEYRALADGTRVRAYDDYLRKSILEPQGMVAQGYDNAEAGMPSYEGILSNEDIASIIMYIRAL